MNTMQTLTLLNANKDSAWEQWPATLRKALRAVSCNGHGQATSCTFGPSREYFYRKYAPDGSSQFVKG